MTLEEKETWLRSRSDLWGGILDRLQIARDQPPLGTNPDERTGWAAAQVDAYETAVEAIYEAQIRADGMSKSGTPS